MTPDERALLHRAVDDLRRVVAESPPPGTLHYGLFALARLLEEIAGSHGPGDAVAVAALEIAHHVVDHGVHPTRPATGAGRRVQEEP